MYLKIWIFHQKKTKNKNMDLTPKKHEKFMFSKNENMDLSPNKTKKPSPFPPLFPQSF